MNNFNRIICESPLLPFIREAEYAERDPWFLPERSLLDYLLIYVQEGCLKVNLHGIEHTFQKGEFCLLQPGDLHTLEGTTKTITPFAHFDMFYNVNREHSFPTRPGQVDLKAFSHLIQPRLNDIDGLQIPIRYQPLHTASFRETMLRMVTLWLEGDLLNHLDAQHLANELILFILKGEASFQLNKYQKKQSLKWITSYFSLHLSETITLEDMANRAHLSPSRFASVFKEQYGTSPHQYLLHLRIQHAQELLSNTVYTVQEIASYCGFADIHHFSKAFKKIIGESPTHYRKNKG